MDEDTFDPKRHLFPPARHMAYHLERILEPNNETAKVGRDLLTLGGWDDLLKWEPIRKLIGGEYLRYFEANDDNLSNCLIWRDEKENVRLYLLEKFHQREAHKRLQPLKPQLIEEFTYVEPPQAPPHKPSSPRKRINWDAKLKAQAPDRKVKQTRTDGPKLGQMKKDDNSS